MTSIDLFSSFPHQECVQRLRNRVGDRFDQYKPVFGRIRDSGFWIRQRLGYRNSFATCLRGSLIDESNGTRIRCRIGMHPLVTGFLTFWVGVLLAVSVYFAAGFASDRPRGTAVIPLAMICFGIVLVALGRFLARGEKEFLIDFLRKALNASPGEPAMSKTP